MATKRVTRIAHWENDKGLPEIKLSTVRCVSTNNFWLDQEFLAPGHPTNCIFFYLSVPNHRHQEKAAHPDLRLP